jgi:hypothetical protein
VMVGVDAGWAGPTDDRWHTGAIDFPAGQEDPDGGEWLLELLLDDSPEAYRRFAEENYELTKPKAGCWTRWSAFAQVRQGSNIQLLPFPLVRYSWRSRKPPVRAPWVVLDFLEYMRYQLSPQISLGQLLL